MKWIYFLTYIAQIGIFTFLTQKFYHIAFGKTKVQKETELLCYCSYFTLTIVLQLYIPEEEIQMTGSLALLALLSLLYEDYKAKKVFSVLSLFLFNTLTHCALLFLSGHGNLQLFSQNTFSGMFGIFLECLTFYGFCIAVSSLQHMLQSDSITESSRAAFAALICIVCLLWFSALATLWIEDRFDILPSILLLLIAVALLTLLFHSFRTVRNQLNLASYQNKYYQNQLELMETSDAALKSLRHDLKNHLLTLSHFLEQDKTSEAKKYLHALSGSLNSGSALSKTGNSTIDSLINYKLHSIHFADLQLDYRAEIPSRLNINPFDLTVILGNLLDNATEALRKLPSDMKNHLSISLKYDRGRFIIRISNSYDPFSLSSPKRLLSTMSEPHLHGIGLKNVQTAAAKYDGILKITRKHRTFTASVILFEPAQENVSQKTLTNSNAKLQ